MDNKGLKIGVGVAAAVAVTSAGVYAAKTVAERQKSAKLAEARQKWESVGENVVVLHHFRRPSSAPSFSPFNIKLETYLRMAGVKYVCDYDFGFSPASGKTPWITVNGQEIADSQMAVEFLAKKFNKDLSSHLGPKDKAVARGLRILMEDHLYWVLMVDRYVDNQARSIVQHFTEMSASEVEALRRKYVKKMTEQCDAQGMSRYSKGDVQRMGVENLQSLSTFLGSKLYMMGGDNPTELDAVLFGFMTVILHTFPEDCVYRIVVEKRLGNLLQHTKRMKNAYYPDWDDIIGKDSLTSLPQAAKPAENGAKNGAKPAQVVKQPPPAKPAQNAPPPSRPPPPAAGSPKSVPKANNQNQNANKPGPPQPPQTAAPKQQQPAQNPNKPQQQQPVKPVPQHQQQQRKK